MKIISHRGYWQVQDEKNSRSAFNRAVNHRFGIETDIRDLNGELVISHDIATIDSQPLSFKDFLSIPDITSVPLALNIKSDGISALIIETMENSGVHDWFVFDMSIPETRAYLTRGAPVYARMSEMEECPNWLDSTKGVWLDAFEGIWYSDTTINTLLDKEKSVCIVSPELHGRDHLPLWNFLRGFTSFNRLELCTDYPVQANKYFHRQH